MRSIGRLFGGLCLKEKKEILWCILGGFSWARPIRDRFEVLGLSLLPPQLATSELRN